MRRFAGCLLYGGADLFMEGLPPKVTRGETANPDYTKKYIVIGIGEGGLAAIQAALRMDAYALYTIGTALPQTHPDYEDLQNCGSIFVGEQKAPTHGLFKLARVWPTISNQDMENCVVMYCKCLGLIPPSK